MRRAELPGFGEDLDEAVGKAAEKAACGVLGKAAAKHLQNVLGGLEGVDQAVQIRTRWRNGGCHPGVWCEVPGVRPRQLVLALEILLGDFEILQGHVRALVTEQFHDGSKADARP